MVFIETIRRFKKSLSGHKPLIEIFVSGENLLHNLGEYSRAYPGLGLIPVLKSNAYGHGLEQVLKVLQNREQPLVAVDSFFEARVVNKFSPRQKVLVIDYARLESMSRADAKTTQFALSSFEQLVNVSHGLKSPRSFHLKIDTGLHRQGILPDQFKSAAELIKANPKVQLVGLFSHLAEAENPNTTETDKQIARWNEAVKFFRAQFKSITYCHLAASAGLRFSARIDANHARLGIGLYGFDPSANPALNLMPALEMKSIVTGLKTLPAGESVGYGFTFKTSEPTLLATIPVGYYEGLDRRLSNLGCVKLNGVYCPIAGRISMNVASLDVSKVPKVKVEDEAEIISMQKNAPNSIENMAKICGTIPYEILVHIPAHLKRQVI